MTLTETITLETVNCWCGTPFAAPEALVRSARNAKHTIYCPHGHACSWTKSEADKLRERLAAVEGNLKYEQECREREQRQHAATKGLLTKERKRVSGGVCPCCNRSFVQLARHMKSQHPDFADAGIHP